MIIKVKTVVVVTLLLTLMAYPVIAEDIYNTEYQVSTYEIPWGNGIDDDFDGVIDEPDEWDVQNGTRVVDEDNSTSQSWFQNFTYPNPLELGVAFDASYETIMKIWSNENISVAPSQSCYYVGWLTQNNATYEIRDNVLEICTFYVNLSPTDIMNGAQEFWYRSPLVWNDPDNDYERHYLNVYDEDNVLVYASPIENASRPPFFDDFSSPKPKYVVDGSSQHGHGGERIYYKLNMNFRTQCSYRFEEYVEIVDDNAINTVSLYVAPNQDIGIDGETDTYVFRGTTYGRKIPMECSWSAVFTVGIGRVGTEGVIFSNSSHVQTMIISNVFSGGDILNTGSCTFLIPLRTTHPVNLSVGYRVRSGGAWSGWHAIDKGDITGLTGSLMIRTNISDPDALAVNYYQLMITIYNWDEIGEDEALLYTMFPSPGDMHSVLYMAAGSWHTDVKHFAMHIEVGNEASTSITYNTGVSGPSILQLLLGIFMILAGIILTAFLITAPVGVPLVVYGVAITTFVLGAYLTADWMAATGMNIPQLFKDGTVRALNAIIEGTTWLVEGLIGVLVTIIEAIKWLGDAVSHWGGVIFSAIAEIIWFLAAVIVMWFWAKFLEIMKWVTLGRPEKALSTLANAVDKATSAPTRITKKAYLRGGGKYVRKAAKSKHWWR